MNHPTFDRALLNLRRQAASRRPAPGAEFLLTRALQEIDDRLPAFNKQFEVGVAMGGGAMLTELLAKSDQCHTVLRAGAQFPAKDGDPVDPPSDDETLPLDDDSIDLAVSAMQLQFVNDLPGLLMQIRRALRPDGLFMAIFIGGESLTELRQALAAAEAEICGGISPRVAPMVELRDLGTLLQRAGFALPVVDVDRVTARYDTLFHLVGDLRAMAATNILTDRLKRPPPRQLFLRAAQIYQDQFSDADGRIRATFDILCATGWAPHDSQQKPLAPGSAQIPLADVLKKK